MQAGVAAEKQERADQVDRDEGDSDRHAGKQQSRRAAEEKERCYLPGHK